VFFKRLYYFKHFFIKKKRRFHLTNKRVIYKLSTMKEYRFKKRYFLKKFFRFKKRLMHLHRFFLVFVHFFFTMFFFNFNRYKLGNIFLLEETVKNVKRSFFLFHLMGPGKTNPKFLESFLSLKSFFSEEGFLRRNFLKLNRIFLKRKNLKRRRRRRFFRAYMKPSFLWKSYSLTFFVGFSFFEMSTSRYY